MKNTQKQITAKRLGNLGFAWNEINALWRIERALHRWAELECGNSDDIKSWHIERDETTGKPFMVTHFHRSDKSNRWPIPDRENGALRRLEKMMKLHDGIRFYHQTDPRGCALYIIDDTSIPDADLHRLYNRGVAVCF